jgi:hypothetical protein
MFVGALLKKKKFDGYIRNNLVELTSINARHSVLVNEMIHRGFKHRSSLFIDNEVLHYLPIDQIYYTINRQEAEKDLIRRCDYCKALFILQPEYRRLNEQEITNLLQTG